MKKMRRLIYFFLKLGLLFLHVMNIQLGICDHHGCSRMVEGGGMLPRQVGGEISIEGGYAFRKKRSQ